MRIAAAAGAVLLALVTSPARAQQGFETAIPGDIASGLASGFGGGVQSGFAGSIGPATPARRRPRDDAYGPQLPEGPFFSGDCAPGQVSLNRSGCRPARELNVGSISSYDLSIHAMSPLGGLVLRDQQLSLPPGPEGPLD